MRKIKVDKIKTSTKSQRLEEINIKRRRKLSVYNRGFALKVKVFDPKVPQIPCFRMEGMDLSGMSTTDSFGRMM